MDLSESAKYSRQMKDEFYSLLKTLLLSYLSTNAFFNIPFIGHWVKHYIFLYLEKAFENERLRLFFKFIDMRSSKQGRDFSYVVDLLEEAKRKGDKNEIARLEKLKNESFDNFVRFNRI